MSTPTPCAFSSWPELHIGQCGTTAVVLLVEHLSGTTREIPAFYMGALEALMPLTLVTFHPARITDRLLSVSRPHGLKPPNGGWLEPLFNGELANVSFFFLACESLNSGDKLKVTCLSHPPPAPAPRRDSRR